LTKFAIFAFPRSGSTYLCSRLNAHPDILCHYEVFHPEAIGYARGAVEALPELAAYTLATRDADPAGFLKTVYANDMGKKAVGLKIFLGHSPEAHRLLLEDKSVRKILLRRSTLDAYVSMVIARQTGLYTSSMGESEQRRVPIEATGLIGFDNQIRAYFMDLEKKLYHSKQEYLTVSYDEIVSSEAGINKILEFIGVDRGSRDLVPFTERQNSDVIEDKVSNLHELVEDLLAFYQAKASRR
jgi:LPS sulfotransferase NodH